MAAPSRRTRRSAAPWRRRPPAVAATRGAPPPGAGGSGGAGGGAPRGAAGEGGRHYTATALPAPRHYVLHGGAEATCYGPDGDGIHGIDESVGLDALHQVTRVLALTI